MKRIFKTLLTAALLTAALCVGAAASDFDAVAQDLSGIGMFRGTAAGFELDRAPTRSEAAIMLVRLYGAEEQAAADYAAGTISHPFTDVSEFSSPYVAWVYTNGISNGTSATTFGSSRACTAQNYTAFLLRALGYKDGTDFQYADAMTFASSKGLLDTSALSGTFLRDDLAAATYQALACDLKDGSTYLLKSLIDAGSIDAAAAKPITDKIEAYRALTAASASLNNSMDADFTMDMKMDMTMTGTMEGQAVNETVSIPMTSKGNVKVLMDSNDIQMAYTMSMTAEGETTEQSMWMKDGWMYVSAAGETYKYQVDDQMSALESLMNQSTAAADVSLLPYIDTITSAKSGSNTVYTLKLNDALSGMVDDVMGAMDPGEVGAMSMNLTDYTVTYTVGSNGQIKSATATMAMTMKMDMADGSDKATVNATVAMDMDMTIKATGSSVKITYPDFSGYQDIGDIIGGADGPTSIITTPAA